MTHKHGGVPNDVREDVKYVTEGTDLRSQPDGRDGYVCPPVTFLHCVMSAGHVGLDTA